MAKKSKKVEELEASTAVPEEAVPEPEAPYCIYVVYTYGEGKRRKFAGSTLRTPFQDIETEDDLVQVINYLTTKLGEGGVTIIDWEPLGVRRSQ